MRRGNRDGRHDANRPGAPIGPNGAPLAQVPRVSWRQYGQGYLEWCQSRAMLYRIIAASPQAFSFQLSASGFRHPSRASGKIVASSAGACPRGPLYSRSVSVTGSIRRVRTRTHGGVAGAGGWPPPLCRSINLTAPGGAIIGTDEKALRVAATQHAAAISPADAFSARVQPAGKPSPGGTRPGLAALQMPL